MTEPRIAEVGRLFVIVQPQPPSLEEAKAELALYSKFAKRLGGPAPMLMLPEKILPPMGQEVRNLYRAAATGDPGVQAMATVIGGLVGLGASIMSSIMTQIFQGRTDIPMRTVRDVEEAVQWLGGIADLQADVSQVVQAVDRLRTPDA
jgi:hypothetical protein